MKTERTKRYQAGLLLLVGILPQLLNGFYNPLIVGNKALFWAVDVLTLTLLPLCIYILGLKLRAFNNQDIGLRQGINSNQNMTLIAFYSLVMALVVYFGYQIFAGIGYLLADMFSSVPEEMLFDFSMALKGEGVSHVFLVLYLSVTAGLVEEFYYRGLFRRVFPEGVNGDILFVLMSSLLFGIVHWEGGFIKVFATFWLGSVLAASYLRIKNLWPFIIGHAIADFVFFI